MSIRGGGEQLNAVENAAAMTWSTPIEDDPSHERVHLQGLVNLYPRLAIMCVGSNEYPAVYSRYNLGIGCANSPLHRRFPPRYGVTSPIT